MVTHMQDVNSFILHHEKDAVNIVSLAVEQLARFFLKFVMFWCNLATIWELFQGIYRFEQSIEP